MNPGRTVLPLTSMTSAPAGIATSPLLPTAWNLPCLDDDHGILDGRPAGAVDQFSTLHDKDILKDILRHICFSSVLPISGLLLEPIF